MPERKKISATCLLNRLVDGEMKAYEEIFVRYYPTLCAYARMYVKREETAENIVQDLMLWLWENRTVLCISTSLPKYLFGAVRNNCLTYLGHESIERRVLGNIRNKMCEQFEVPDFDVVEELRENIRAAVAELPALLLELELAGRILPRSVRNEPFPAQNLRRNRRRAGSFAQNGGLPHPAVSENPSCQTQGLPAFADDAAGRERIGGFTVSPWLKKTCRTISISPGAINSDRMLVSDAENC